MFKLDLGQRNAAVSILFTMTLVFLGLGIALRLHPATAGVGQDVWTVFNGSWSCLLLILNAEAKKDSGLPPDNPTPPNAAQPK